MPTMQVIRKRPDTRRQSLARGIERAGQALGTGLKDYAQTERQRTRQEEVDWKSWYALSGKNIPAPMRDLWSDWAYKKGYLDPNHPHYDMSMEAVEKTYIPDRDDFIKAAEKFLSPKYEQSKIFGPKPETTAGDDDAMTEESFDPVTGKLKTPRAKGRPYLPATDPELMNRERSNFILTYAKDLDTAMAYEAAFDSVGKRVLPGLYEPSSDKDARANPYYLKAFPINKQPSPDGATDKEQLGQQLGGRQATAADLAANNQAIFGGPQESPAPRQAGQTPSPAVQPQPGPPQRGVQPGGPQVTGADMAAAFAPNAARDGPVPASGTPQAIRPAIADPTAPNINVLADGLRGASPAQPPTTAGPQPSPRPTSQDPAEQRIIAAFAKVDANPGVATRGSREILSKVLAIWPPAKIQAAAAFLDQGVTEEQLVTEIMKEFRGK